MLKKFMPISIIVLMSATSPGSAQDATACLNALVQSVLPLATNQGVSNPCNANPSNCPEIITYNLNSTLNSNPCAYAWNGDVAAKRQTAQSTQVQRTVQKKK